MAAAAIRRILKICSSQPTPEVLSDPNRLKLAAVESTAPRISVHENWDRPRILLPPDFSRPAASTATSCRPNAATKRAAAAINRSQPILLMGPANEPWANTARTNDNAPIASGFKGRALGIKRSPESLYCKDPARNLGPTDPRA
jgi:hypothetical protein